MRICHTDIIVFSAAENEVRKACAQATAPVFPEAGQAAAAAGLEKSRFDVSWMPEASQAVMMALIRCIK